MDDVIFYNGKFISEREFSISGNNRAFNYGDAFFETVKIINSKLFNFNYHMQRIQKAFNTLKLDDFLIEDSLKNTCIDLLQANKIVHGSIKIHVSRRGIGKYLPENNKSNLYIKSVHGLGYQINNPISLCFYQEQRKNIGSLSNIKSANSLVSVLASIYARENNFDNAILLNYFRDVIEVANANIFLVKSECVYTPPLLSGCVDGTMRKWVSKKFTIVEKSILKSDLLDADEVFVTNASNGIIPVGSIEKIFFKDFDVAKSIQNKLINLSLDF